MVAVVMDLRRRPPKATVALAGLTLLGVLASGCRERTRLCAESNCSLPDSPVDEPDTGEGTGGGAGAPPTGPSRGGDEGDSGTGGGGGQAVECTGDRDCDDGVACNGDEVCESGRCIQTPRECPEPTRCVEQPSGFTCEFERDPNWVIYAGNDLAEPYSLLARPLNYLDESPPIELIPGNDLNVYMSPVTGHEWSPNGRYLTLEAGSGFLDPRLRIFLVGFGGGLPEPAQLLKDVPQRTDVLFEDWSLDSKRALVVNYGYKYEGYVVDLEQNKTSLLFADEVDVDSLKFCADSRLVLRDSPGGPRLIDTETKSLKREYPGATELSLSPDKRWILLENAEGYWVTPCAAGGDPQLLMSRRGEDQEFFYEWSSDSELAALQVEDGEVNVFDAGAGFNLLAAFQGNTYSLAWSPTAHRLTFNRSDEGAVAAFVVDFSSEPPSPVRLSTARTDVSDVTWVNDELLAYGAHAEDGSYEAHLVKAVPPFDDRLALRFPADMAFHSLEYDPHGRYLFFVQEAGELEQLYALSLSNPAAKPEPVFDAPMQPTLTIEAFTPDASGLILQYQGKSPQPLSSVWWVAFDEHGIERPRAINDGDVAGFATLGPRR